ncbi:hypothetical protein BA190_24005 [Labrys sp. WJW]|uniref:hypothetical protein n=1 Tax=Labrys sp. WJW TaxID=1737983 RepID=UPI0008350151|nr:hypothetical protein [Labrys sp. WJW]OCC02392.1 hypothetical protein BA190_24005 [Labrys sp. WJW]
MNSKPNPGYIDVPPDAIAAHEARLRAITRSEGKRPTPYRGVVRQARACGEFWSATIKDPRLGSRGRAYLGTYPRPDVAAIAYDFALILLGLPPVNYAESVYRTGLPEEKLGQGMEEVRQFLVKAGWQSAEVRAESTPAYRLH